MLRPVITIGTFDGVHIGHRYLLQETAKKAKALNTKSVVITYPVHPLEVIHDIVFPYMLTEPFKRESLIRKTGIDEIAYLNFDKKMSRMSAEEFLIDIIVKKFNPQAMIVGYDTHFGFNRCGNSAFIKDYAKNYDIEIVELKPYTVGDIIPGSSLIRDLISAGHVDSAFKYLGYYYSVAGEVVSGKKIGRTLGFPTINLKANEPNKLIPAKGVYFSCTKFNNHFYYGATNIGVSPSVKDEGIIEIETFLFNFSGNIYHEDIEVFFIEKIRDEKKFDSHEELVNQIFTDVKNIKSKIEDFHNWSIIREF